MPHDGWRQAIQKELDALCKNQTQRLAKLPREKKVVGWRWVLTVKQNPDRTVDRLKARPVAKEYVQTIGIDYFGTFSYIVKLNFVRVVIPISANKEFS